MSGTTSVVFKPGSNGAFYIGDKVRVVLEGTHVGHYYLKGASWSRDGIPHVPWLYTLHWSTDAFQVATS